MFGPTTGDRVRLADTELVIEVEEDRTLYGDEVKFGGGKVIRDGMGQSQATRAEGAVDLVDHERADPRPLGRREGRHRRSATAASPAIGKAGNPDVQGSRERPVDIVIGPATEVIAGEGRIVTAGGIDVHIHFICPQQIDEALLLGRHDDDRRRHRTRDGHERHHLHARPLEPAPHDRGGRRVPDEPRLPRQGEREPARGAARAGRGRRLRAQAPRGLGHDAGRDRLLPRRRGRDRRPGRRSTPTRSTSRASSRRRSPRSRGARSTPSTPRAPAAATRRTSSACAASRT